MDVTRAESVDDALAGIVANVGVPDILVNNAGVTQTKPLLDVGEQDWNGIIDVNLNGAWRVAQRVARAMKDASKGGSIINISSILGLRVAQQLPAYSASKAALDGMIRALAQEGSVRINNVNPGIIDTPMFRRFADEVTAQPFIQHTPTRRLGTPDDVAEVVVWLCSDGARFVTGQNVLIDGGYTIPGHRAWLSGEVAPQ